MQTAKEFYNCILSNTVPTLIMNEYGLKFGKSNLSNMWLVIFVVLLIIYYSFEILIQLNPIKKYQRKKNSMVSNKF